MMWRNAATGIGAWLLFCSTIALPAQTSTWTGGALSNYWSAAANWGGTAPVSGNALTFAGTTRQTNTNDLSGLANLNTVTFSTAGWNISGNAVSVTSGFVESANGSNTWGLNTTLSNTVSISQSASGEALNFTGILSGPGGLSSVAGSGGVGVIYLSKPDNSFSGGVSIASATAVFYSLANPGQNSSLGAGGDTVTFGSTATSYEGSLVYAGTNSCSTTRAFEGEARTTGSPSFSNNSPNNSSLTFNGGWSGHGNLNPFTLLLQGSSTGTNTFNAPITQSSPFPVSLQVNGPGTWVFANNNTYLGTTTINSGLLQLGSGGTTGNASTAATNSIFFASSATLAINRSDSPVFVNNLTLGGADTIAVASGKTVTLGGIISGSGALVNNSPNGTLVLTNANTYTGYTAIRAGELALGAAGSLSNSSSINIAGGAVFDVSAVSGGFSLGANQAINATGATGIINGNVNFGAGSLVLSFLPGTPTLTITGGTLALSNNRVTVILPGYTNLPAGSYQLISPGSGGSVSGSVSASLVSVNAAGNQAVSLQITNGGLYLVVNSAIATIPTAVSVVSSLNPATYDTVPVIFTATVSPAPADGEVVYFMDGTNTLAAGALTGGSAAFSTATLAIGTHCITALYGGDALYLPGTSSSLTQVVNQVAVCYPQGAAFPLFMYEAGSYPTLAAYGWNIMQDYGQSTNSDVNNFLQELLADNVAGPAIIPANPTGTGDVDSPWSAAQIQAWVQAIAGNTNLAWWSLPEEMLPWNSTAVSVLADYTPWTRLYDPAQRPTYEYTENTLNAANMATVIAHVDVLGISCYCEALEMPHAWVRYKVEQGVKAAALAGDTLGSNYLLGGQKTLVAVLSIAQYPNTNGWPSEPTPAQTYHDFWSAIASGAQGIAVWSYAHAGDDPSNLTNNLNELNLAASQITGLERIGDVILDGTLNSNVSCTVTSGPANTVSFQPAEESTNFQYPSINVRSKTWNGYVYVIAVNSTSNTVAATISSIPSPAASAVLPFESRSVAMTNGAFSDTFPAWGVHIYKMAATTPALVAPVVNPVMPSGGGRFSFSFSGPNAQSYHALTSTNLRLPVTNWLVLTNGTFSGATVNYTNATPKDPQRFYIITSP